MTMTRRKPYDFSVQEGVSEVWWIGVKCLIGLRTDWREPRLLRIWGPWHG